MTSASPTEEQKRFHALVVRAAAVYSGDADEATLREGAPASPLCAKEDQSLTTCKNTAKKDANTSAVEAVHRGGRRQSRTSLAIPPTCRDVAGPLQQQEQQNTTAAVVAARIREYYLAPSNGGHAAVPSNKNGLAEKTNASLSHLQRLETHYDARMKSLSEELATTAAAAATVPAAGEGGATESETPTTATTSISATATLQANRYLALYRWFHQNNNSQCKDNSVENSSNAAGSSSSPSVVPEDYALQRAALAELVHVSAAASTLVLPEYIGGSTGPSSPSSSSSPLPSFPKEALFPFVCAAQAYRTAAYNAHAQFLQPPSPTAAAASASTGAAAERDIISRPSSASAILGNDRSTQPPLPPPPMIVSERSIGNNLTDRAIRAVHRCQHVLIRRRTASGGSGGGAMETATMGFDPSSSSPVLPLSSASSCGGDAVVDLVEMCIVRLWCLPHQGQTYMRSLTNITDAMGLHGLSLGVLAAPLAASVRSAGCFFTVTWLLPLLSARPLTAAPVAVPTAEEHAAAASAATKLDTTVISKKTLLSTVLVLIGSRVGVPAAGNGALEVYGGADGRFYVLPAAHLAHTTTTTTTSTAKTTTTQAAPPSRIGTFVCFGAEAPVAAATAAIAKKSSASTVMPPNATTANEEENARLFAAASLSTRVCSIDRVPSDTHPFQRSECLLEEFLIEMESETATTTNKTLSSKRSSSAAAETLDTDQKMKRRLIVALKKLLPVGRRAFAEFEKKQRRDDEEKRLAVLDAGESGGNANEEKQDEKDSAGGNKSPTNNKQSKRARSSGALADAKLDASLVAPDTARSIDSAGRRSRSSGHYSSRSRGGSASNGAASSLSQRIGRGGIAGAVDAISAVLHESGLNVSHLYAIGASAHWTAAAQELVESGAVTVPEAAAATGADDDPSEKTNQEEKGAGSGADSGSGSPKLSLAMMAKLKKKAVDVSGSARQVLDAARAPARQLILINMIGRAIKSLLESSMAAAAVTTAAPTVSSNSDAHDRDAMSADAVAQLRRRRLQAAQAVLQPLFHLASREDLAIDALMPQVKHSSTSTKTLKGTTGAVVAIGRAAAAAATNRTGVVEGGGGVGGGAATVPAAAPPPSSADASSLLSTPHLAGTDVHQPSPPSLVATDDSDAILAAVNEILKTKFGAPADFNFAEKLSLTRRERETERDEYVTSLRAQLRKARKSLASANNSISSPPPQPQQSASNEKGTDGGASSSPAAAAAAAATATTGAGAPTTNTPTTTASVLLSTASNVPAYYDGRSLLLLSLQFACRKLKIAYEDLEEREVNARNLAAGASEATALIDKQSNKMTITTAVTAKAKQAQQTLQKAAEVERQAAAAAADAATIATSLVDFSAYPTIVHVTASNPPTFFERATTFEEKLDVLLAAARRLEQATTSASSPSPSSTEAGPKGSGGSAGGGNPYIKALHLTSLAVALGIAIRGATAAGQSQGPTPANRSGTATATAASNATHTKLRDVLRQLTESTMRLKNKLSNIVVSMVVCAVLAPVALVTEHPSAGVRLIAGFMERLGPLYGLATADALNASSGVGGDVQQQQQQQRSTSVSPPPSRGSSPPAGAGRSKNNTTGADDAAAGSGGVSLAQTTTLGQSFALLGNTSFLLNSYDNFSTLLSPQHNINNPSSASFASPAVAVAAGANDDGDETVSRFFFTLGLEPSVRAAGGPAAGAGVAFLDDQLGAKVPLVDTGILASVLYRVLMAATQGPHGAPEKLAAAGIGVCPVVSALTSVVEAQAEGMLRHCLASTASSFVSSDLPTDTSPAAAAASPTSPSGVIKKKALPPYYLAFHEGSVEMLLNTCEDMAKSLQTMALLFPPSFQNQRSGWQESNNNEDEQQQHTEVDFESKMRRLHTLLAYVARVLRRAFLSASYKQYTRLQRRILLQSLQPIANAGIGSGTDDVFDAKYAALLACFAASGREYASVQEMSEVCRQLAEQGDDDDENEKDNVDTEANVGKDKPKQQLLRSPLTADEVFALSPEAKRLFRRKSSTRSNAGDDGRSPSFVAEKRRQRYQNNADEVISTAKPSRSSNGAANYQRCEWDLYRFSVYAVKHSRKQQEQPLVLSGRRVSLAVDSDDELLNDDDDCLFPNGSNGGSHKTQQQEQQNGAFFFKWSSEAALAETARLYESQWYAAATQVVAEEYSNVGATTGGVASAAPTSASVVAACGGLRSPTAVAKPLYSPPAALIAKPFSGKAALLLPQLPLPPPHTSRLLDSGEQQQLRSNIFKSPRPISSRAPPHDITTAGHSPPPAGLLAAAASVSPRGGGPTVWVQAIANNQQKQQQEQQENQQQPSSFDTVRHHVLDFDATDSNVDAGSGSVSPLPVQQKKKKSLVRQGGAAGGGNAVTLVETADGGEAQPFSSSKGGTAVRQRSVANISIGPGANISQDLSQCNDEENDSENTNDAHCSNAPQLHPRPIFGVSTQLPTVSQRAFDAEDDDDDEGDAAGGALWSPTANVTTTTGNRSNGGGSGPVQFTPVGDLKVGTAETTNNAGTAGGGGGASAAVSLPVLLLSPRQLSYLVRSEAPFRALQVHVLREPTRASKASNAGIEVEEAGTVMSNDASGLNDDQRVAATPSNAITTTDGFSASAAGTATVISVWRPHFVGGVLNHVFIPQQKQSTSNPPNNNKSGKECGPLHPDLLHLNSDPRTQCRLAHYLQQWAHRDAAERRLVPVINDYLPATVHSSTDTTPTNSFVEQRTLQQHAAKRAGGGGSITGGNPALVGSIVLLRTANSSLQQVPSNASIHPSPCATPLGPGSESAAIAEDTPHSITTSHAPITSVIASPSSSSSPRGAGSGAPLVLLEGLSPFRTSARCVIAKEAAMEVSRHLVHMACYLDDRDRSNSNEDDDPSRWAAAMEQLEAERAEAAAEIAFEECLVRLGAVEEPFARALFSEMTWSNDRLEIQFREKQSRYRAQVYTSVPLVNGQLPPQHALRREEARRDEAHTHALIKQHFFYSDAKEVTARMRDATNAAAASPSKTDAVSAAAAATSVNPTTSSAAVATTASSPLPALRQRMVVTGVHALPASQQHDAASLMLRPNHSSYSATTSTSLQQQQQQQQSTTPMIMESSPLTSPPRAVLTLGPVIRPPSAPQRNALPSATEQMRAVYAVTAAMLPLGDGLLQESPPPLQPRMLQGSGAGGGAASSVLPPLVANPTNPTTTTTTTTNPVYVPYKLRADVAQEALDARRMHKLRGKHVYSDEHQQRLLQGVASDGNHRTVVTGEAIDSLGDSNLMACATIATASATTSTATSVSAVLPPLRNPLVSTVVVQQQQQLIQKQQQQPAPTAAATLLPAIVGTGRIGTDGDVSLHSEQTSRPAAAAAAAPAAAAPTAAAEARHSTVQNGQRQKGDDVVSRSLQSDFGTRDRRDKEDKEGKEEVFNTPGLITPKKDITTNTSSAPSPAAAAAALKSSSTSTTPAAAAAVPIAAGSTPPSQQPQEEQLHTTAAATATVSTSFPLASLERQRDAELVMASCRQDGTPERGALLHQYPYYYQPPDDEATTQKYRVSLLFSDDNMDDQHHEDQQTASPTRNLPANNTTNTPQKLQSLRSRGQPAPLPAPPSTIQGGVPDRMLLAGEREQLLLMSKAVPYYRVFPEVDVIAASSNNNNNNNYNATAVTASDTPLRGTLLTCKDTTRETEEDEKNSGTVPTTATTTLILTDPQLITLSERLSFLEGRQRAALYARQECDWIFLESARKAQHRLCIEQCILPRLRAQFQQEEKERALKQIALAAKRQEERAWAAALHHEQQQALQIASEAMIEQVVAERLRLWHLRESWWCASVLHPINYLVHVYSAQQADFDDLHWRCQRGLVRLKNRALMDAAIFAATSASSAAATTAVNSSSVPPPESVLVPTTHGGYRSVLSEQFSKHRDAAKAALALHHEQERLQLVQSEMAMRERSVLTAYTASMKPLYATHTLIMDEYLRRQKLQQKAFQEDFVEGFMYSFVKPALALLQKEEAARHRVLDMEHWTFSRQIAGPVDDAVDLYTTVELPALEEKYGQEWALQNGLYRLLNLKNHVLRHCELFSPHAKLLQSLKQHEALLAVHASGPTALNGNATPPYGHNLLLTSSATRAAAAGAMISAPTTYSTPSRTAVAVAGTMPSQHHLRNGDGGDTPAVHPHHPLRYTPLTIRSLRAAGLEQHQGQHREEEHTQPDAAAAAATTGDPARFRRTLFPSSLRLSSSPQQHPSQHHYGGHDELDLSLKEETGFHGPVRASVGAAAKATAASPFYQQRLGMGPFTVNSSAATIRVVSPDVRTETIDHKQYAAAQMIHQQPQQHQQQQHHDDSSSFVTAREEYLARTNQLVLSQHPHSPPTTTGTPKPTHTSGEGGATPSSSISSRSIAEQEAVERRGIDRLFQQLLMRNDLAQIFRAQRQEAAAASAGALPGRATAMMLSR